MSDLDPENSARLRRLARASRGEMMSLAAFTIARELPWAVPGLLDELERLRARVTELEQLNAGLSDRVAAQSEILTQRAERA